jgi:hypothetical protein
VLFKPLGFICGIVLLAFTGSVLAQTVVIYPKRIDDVLTNPGMGIQTFQRFNGDALNAGVSWSEAGPTGPIPAATGPVEFPPSTIAYCRWFWETLEPEKGKIHWEIIDRALDEAAKHKQSLAIRLMPYDPKHPLPAWYRASGAKRANHEGDPVWEPDFSDPLYLRNWGDLVKQAGQRYNGDPRLDTVDISSVGYWGEGWSNYMPAFQFQKALIDIWTEAFPSTHLLMNFDEPEALHYGTAHGAGWRFDCLGDLGGLTAKGSEMLDVYPEQIVRAGIQNVWEKSPVSMETCWVPEHWKQQGWDVGYILNEALRWHISSINIKSSAIPNDWRPAFDRFQKRMGYRLELRRFEYPSRIHPGHAIPVKMWWVNSGVAPPYNPYILALSLHSSSGDSVIEVPADVREWLPGDILVEQDVPVPTDAGDATRIRVALLDPRTHKPAINLPIVGRTEDGWYDLGPIGVSMNSSRLR